jgi:hypothetical protein
LLVETMSPMTLEVALAVPQEIQSRREEADRLRRTQVERARYEARLAQQRYLLVDPANRLVADVLEADWNRKLRALTEAEQEYERQHPADLRALDQEQRQQIFSRATDFGQLWADPRTPFREKKRMVRLLIEDVTLTKSTEITAGVRFRGGALRTIPLPKSRAINHLNPAVVAEIDRLLTDPTLPEMAAHLNERGIRTATGRLFTAPSVNTVVQVHGLKSRYRRWRAQGLGTSAEVAALLHTTAERVKKLYRRGLLQGQPYSEDGRCLYFPPQPGSIPKRLPKLTTKGDKGGAISKGRPNFHHR